MLQMVSSNCGRLMAKRSSNKKNRMTIEDKRHEQDAIERFRIVVAGWELGKEEKNKTWQSGSDCVAVRHGKTKMLKTRQKMDVGWLRRATYRWTSDGRSRLTMRENESKK